MLSNDRQSESGWLKRALTKIFCVELPIVGPCFEHNDYVAATRGVLKCTSMLVGGAVGMSLTSHYMHDSKPMTEMSWSESGTVVGGMGAGMYVGKVGYLIIENGMLGMYNICKQRASAVAITAQQEELELITDEEQNLPIREPANNSTNNLTI